MVDIVFGSVESADQFLGCFECCKSIFLCVTILECSDGFGYLVDESVHMVALVGAVFIGAVGGTVGSTIGSAVGSSIGMGTV